MTHTNDISLLTEDDLKLFIKQSSAKIDYKASLFCLYYGLRGDRLDGGNPFIFPKLSKDSSVNARLLKILDNLCFRRDCVIMELDGWRPTGESEVKEFKTAYEEEVYINNLLQKPGVEEKINKIFDCVNLEVFVEIAETETFEKVSAAGRYNYIGNSAIYKDASIAIAKKMRVALDVMLPGRTKLVGTKTYA